MIESSYEEFLQIIIQKCNEINLFPDPQIINKDFEKAVINAIKTVIGEDYSSTHRKIQQLGLEQLYRSNEDFSHFCRMLDSLAFLPVHDINTGLTYLKSVMPEEATDLGRIKELETAIGNTYKLRKISPHFPPSVWNLRDATLNNEDRTT
ncbi:hypothetical protein ACI65C_012265 [Semiaphis heraclei]